MLEWLAMGGYAAFVWGSYACALGALAGLCMWAAREHAAALRALRDAGLKE